MKIAHVITRLIIGGAQENTLLNCEDLLQRYGDDVLLVVGPTTGPEGTLMDRAATTPHRVLPNLVRQISPRRDFSAYGELKRTLREFKPDVVHTHSAKAGILGRAAAWSLGVPAIVHSVHGAPFHPYQNFLAREFYKRCEHWAARRCHAFVSVADAMTHLMLDAKIAPPEMFTTVYSGMEIEPFLESEGHRDTVRKEFGFAESDFVVGKIARLFHLKGHEFVLAAAPKIVAAVPHVRFFFVGDGILTDRYKAEIIRRGLEKHFVFAGLVSPSRIPAIISAMDVVVHTSLREGLARVLPQALLSGKPVISYDIDGAGEVVRHGETGFLLPPKSVDGLVDAVVELAGNPRLRHTMGHTGRERFAQQFDYRYMTARIREIYVRVLNQSPPKGKP